LKEAAVIIGASSGLGRALATTLAAQGIDLIVAARTERDLQALANDLAIRYKVAVKVLPVDSGKLDEARGKDFVEQCFQTFADIRQVYITAAMIHDDDVGEESIQVLKQMQEVNFLGLSYLVVPFAKRLSSTESNITVISSIATIRPRSRNVAYAASKIALEYYVRGLQHLYADKPIRLQIYRMGYMQTAMTAGKKLALPVADPHQVATYLFAHRRSSFRLRYYPRFWALVALILPLLPWAVYKKLKH
jgi:short-subunit dehydrogenase